MTSPKEFQDPRTISPRLVTKTSLPDAKKTLALAILMWQAVGKPSEIEYGVQQTAAGPMQMDDVITDSVYAYLNGLLSLLPAKGEIQSWIQSNPLLSSQAEALNAAFELVWHLGRFSFTDRGLNITAERTGGKRYRKLLRYTNNVDVLDAFAETDRAAFAAVLLSWISDGKYKCDKESQAQLVRILTSFAELSFYKTSKGSDALVYVPSGVYNALSEGAQSVALVDPGAEAQGPTRILKSAIRDGLNTYLAIGSSNEAVLADGIDKDALESYARRVQTGIELSRIVVETERSAVGNDDEGVGEIVYRNLIFFGAPGTGKSYELNARAVGKEGKEGAFKRENVRRVTFHPDYTYSQFVGCYKPTEIEVTKKDADGNVYREPVVTYAFVPGPFLETYIKAVQNPSENYLLIVEEINRANPAAVFGDIFQLLDRGDDGSSEYEIAVPWEMRQFLEVRMPEYANAAAITDPKTLLDEQARLKEETKRLSIPSNMYIWTTMNSADQGVFPMDTAFKRRWDFEYMDINNAEEKIDYYVVPIGDTGRAPWNQLRKGINKLLRDAKINEDKWLGPFFINPKTLKDGEAFNRAFKDKVLLYLYEDAAKTKRSSIFAGEGRTYSEICAAYDTDGVGIFKEFGVIDLSPFDDEDDGGADVDVDSDNQSNLLDAE